MDKLKRIRIAQSEIDKLTPEERAERRAKYKCDWNAKNHDKVVRMRSENIEKKRDIRKEQIANHRKSNPLIMFTRNTLTRITAEKAKEAMSKLPYTQDEFVNHIESLFVSGMSWSNRSEWHIDHIRPLSAFIKEGSFDLNTINALSNLQPLWVKDNLKKSTK